MHIDCTDYVANLAFAGAKDGFRDELAVIAESGIWPVCIPRDALQSSTTTNLIVHISFFHLFLIQVPCNADKIAAQCTHASVKA